MAPSAELFHSVFSHAGVGIGLADISGVMLQANRALEQILGFGPGELTGVPISHLLVPEDVSAYERDFADLLAGRVDSYQVDRRYLRRDGQTVWVHLAVSLCRDAQGRPETTISVVQNIQQRKAAELSLAASEARYRALVESSEDAIFQVDGQGRLAYINPGGARLLGCLPQQIVGSPLQAVLGPVTAAAADGLLRLPGPGQAAIRVDDTISVGGRTRHLSLVLVPLSSACGEPESLVGIARDVTDLEEARQRLGRAYDELELKIQARTAALSEANHRLLQEAAERRRAEETIRATEERFRTIIRALPMGMHLYQLDQADRLLLIDANHAADAMTGIETWRLLGMTIEEAFPGLSATAVPARFRDIARNGGNLHLSELHYDDGRTRGVFDVDAFQSAPRRLAVVFTNVTERKAAEEQLRCLQSQLAHVGRLSVMGEMATGLAHEINQPLASVAAYAQGCLKLLANPSVAPQELAGPLEDIIAEARRAGEVVRRVRSFVRDRTALRAAVDPNALVLEVLRIIGHDARQNDVALQLELANDLPLVMVDPIQIQQVLLNLVRNSVEALAQHPVERRTVVLRTAMDSPRAVRLSVTDNGPGLCERAAQRLFEPFFSTKPEGLGMGLCISRTIVESYGGRLDVRWQPDRGCTFEFTVPVDSHPAGD